MTEKYNVVTLGSRDYYQVAISLLENNCLGYLITDFYAGHFVSKFTSKRSVTGLTPQKTISLFPFFLLAKILSLSPFLHKIRRYIVDFLFGFIAGFVTKLTSDRAIVYSYYIEGFVAFYRLIGSKPKGLVCFQVHPSPWYINEIILDDLHKSRTIGYNAFDYDIESTYEHAAMIRYMSALNFCDSIICASSFTARSVGQGLSPNIPIGVIPYGSKLEALGGGNSLEHEKIKLVTVCQLSQRKGF